MFGYVRPIRDKLEESDKVIFDGYYCGVCKSIARRYTSLGRMTLSYDCTFLALLISAVMGEDGAPIDFRCVGRKRKLVESQIIDYCADINLLLTYYKLMDDVNDDNSIKAKAAVNFLKKAYTKAKDQNQIVDKAICANLDYLYGLEKDKCDNPDFVADAFGRLLEAVGGYGSNSNKGVMAVCYNLGKYIYLIDAFVDYEDDIKSGSYNVFYEKYGKVSGLKEKVSFLFECVLSELVKQYKTLKININVEIINNILYLGIIQPLLCGTDGEKEKE